MYGSPSMSKDLNLPFPASPFRQGNEVVDLRQGHQQQQQQEMGPSGLLRYRTAPSNVLGDVCDGGVGAESMFARFVSPDLRDHLGAEKRRSSGSPSEGVPSSPSQTTGFPSSGPPHMFFQAPLHHHPRQQHNPNPTSAASGGVESGGSTNIVRHGSSSPPGLFCHLNAHNGFAGLRNMGGFRSPGGSGDNTEVGTSSGRLKGQISFNSRQGSLMSQVSDIGSDGLGGSSSEEGSGGGGCSARCYIPGYPVASWEDAVLLSDSFSGGGKRIRYPSQVQNGDSRSHVPTLTHHFSSPKASAEAMEMERFLHFQDAVPCKVRAKRGCATHPRSIAERVRRTQISERMRKLQELVPNMEKQTNTADMLDLAVDYIKDLQRQAKMLTERREKCTCSGKRTHPQP